jgi:hypothetical protein
MYAKYQMSFLENFIGVRSENDANVDTNVFSSLPVLTENAVKLVNILTENQAHSFLIFFICIVPLSTFETLNYYL